MHFNLIKYIGDAGTNSSASGIKFNLHYQSLILLLLSPHQCSEQRTTCLLIKSLNLLVQWQIFDICTNNFWKERWLTEVLASVSPNSSLLHKQQFAPCLSKGLLRATCVKCGNPFKICRGFNDLILPCIFYLIEGWQPTCLLCCRFFAILYKLLWANKDIFIVASFSSPNRFKLNPLILLYLVSLHCCCLLSALSYLFLCFNKFIKGQFLTC